MARSTKRASRWPGRSTTGLAAAVVLMDPTGLLLLWPLAWSIAAGVVVLSCIPRLDQAGVDRVFARLISGF